MHLGLEHHNKHLNSNIWDVSHIRIPFTQQTLHYHQDEVDFTKTLRLYNVWLFGWISTGHNSSQTSSRYGPSDSDNLNLMDYYACATFGGNWFLFALPFFSRFIKTLNLRPQTWLVQVHVCMWQSLADTNVSYYWCKNMWNWPCLALYVCIHVFVGSIGLTCHLQLTSAS